MGALLLKRMQEKAGKLSSSSVAIYTSTGYAPGFTEIDSALRAKSSERYTNNGSATTIWPESNFNRPISFRVI